MRVTSTLRSLAGRLGQDVFHGWVHPAISDDLVRRQHTALMASHVQGGALAAIVLAGTFAISGAFGLAALLATLAFLAPLAVAAYLSHSGRLDIAQLLTATQLASIVTLAAALSGGSRSFAIIWLILVPLEAALSRDRRLMIAATALALALLVALHAATVNGMLPAPARLPVALDTLTLASHIGAACYAAMIVAAVQTMSRSAAERLEESRAEYRLIAESTSDLITRHDQAGRIVFASLAARSVLEAAPEVLTSEGFAAALPPDAARRAEEAIRIAGRTGTRVIEELQRTGPDGSTRWLEIACEPLPGGRGVLAATRDITARKRNELATARARAVAEEASRAKSAFIATISHELRTPLNAIIGFSELLHRELIIKAREPKHADYCRIIHESGEHLLSLVRDLLDVSKIEAGKLSICAEPFVLADVIGSSVDTLRPAALARSQRLEIATSQATDELVADRRAVKQMLINLISNACKFSAEGGVIRIETSVTGSKVRIAVRDSGIGIAPEHVVRLGQPFYQVETSYARQQEGAGLGLAIVRGLAELHGGRLEIESVPGVGSCFSLVLPIDAEAALDARVSDIDPMGGASIHILAPRDQRLPRSGHPPIGEAALAVAV